MTKLLFTSLLSFCFIVTGFSQVSINEDFPIDVMVLRYAESNKSQETIEGWRIQIMAKTDRMAIESAREKFMIEYPDVTIDWTHTKPYYRLRAGAFQTKLDAIKMLQVIKNDYPGAFPVKDDIKKQELLPEF